MPRPSTKTDLLQAANENYEKLNNLISCLTEAELNTDFDFSDDAGKKEAHWNRDKNLRDILIHLYEWHRLILNWVDSNMSGKPSPFLPEPYNWKTYGDMNVEFWKKHQNTPLDDAKRLLDATHKEVIALADRFSNDELFLKSAFSWTGTTTLGSYFVSATSSHYDWAIKKLKAHQKRLKILPRR